MDNLQRVNLPDNVEGTRARVAENDLLFSITAEIGMLGLVPAGFGEAYINQHVGLIRFLKEAQTKIFLYDYGYTAEQIACAMNTDINLVALKVAHLTTLGYNLRSLEHKSNFLK